MAQFRGTLEGARGSASRLGHKGSGLVTTARGWDVGVRVEATHEDGRDVFRVWRDGGSNNGTRVQLLVEVRGAETASGEAVVIPGHIAERGE